MNLIFSSLVSSLSCFLFLNYHKNFISKEVQMPFALAGPEQRSCVSWLGYNAGCPLCPYKFLAILVQYNSLYHTQELVDGNGLWSFRLSMVQDLLYHHIWTLLLLLTRLLLICGVHHRYCSNFLGIEVVRLIA